MGKVFRKALPLIGLATGGIGGTLVGSAIKDHVLKKDKKGGSSSSDDTKDRLKKLEAENEKMRESMFNMQESMFAQNKNSEERMNSPLLRW